MGLTFDSLTIPGTVKPWAPGVWDVANQVHAFFGLEGEGHLYGGRTGRDLMIPIWVYDGYSNYSSLTSKLSAIEAKIGRVGTIAETSGVSVTFPLSKLMTMERDKQGPIPPNTHIGWSQHIVLNFRQMTP